MDPPTSFSHTRTFLIRAEFALPSTPKELTLVEPKNERKTPSCNLRDSLPASMDYVQHRHDLTKVGRGAKLSRQCPRLIWDGERREGNAINNQLPKGSELDSVGFNQLLLERRGSIESIVSTTSSPKSSPSTTPSDDSPCSEIPWKRQREDTSDQLVSTTLPPALRPDYEDSKCRLVADVDLSTELKTLKYKFLTYERSGQALPSGSCLFDNMLRRVGRGVVTSGTDHLCGDDRVPSTGRQLEKNTFPDQCSPSNFVTAPVTHPADFQSGILRRSSILSSTGRSECAYTPTGRDDPSLVPQNTGSYPPHARLHHQHNSPRISPTETYRHPCQASSTNGNDHSRGSLMDRHAGVDHSFTSSVPQRIALEDLTFHSTCSKSSRGLDFIHNITSGNTLLAKATRINCNDLPSRHEFTAAIDAYLSTLSSKKLPKALITKQLYDDIIFNLKREQDSLPGIGTPQFRFWCRKHFVLKTIPRLRLREQAEIPHSAIALPIGNQDGGDSSEVEVVTHDGQPVVTRENIYDILIKCHTLANHAGRDKTTAIVKQNYSWVPKVLIGDFVKLCPVCYSKKVSGATWAHLRPKSDLTPLG